MKQNLIESCSMLSEMKHTGEYAEIFPIMCTFYVFHARNTHEPT